MEVLVPHVVSELSNEDMDILECGYRYLVNHKVSKSVRLKFLVCKKT